MNAMTCLETLLTREQATIRHVVAGLRADHQKAHPAPPPPPLAPERQQRERRARRSARYERVVQLKAQGWSQRAMAQETGLHRQTVAIYLTAEQFPERAPHPTRSRVMEPYLEYLQHRWEQGEHHGHLFFEEIRAQGYSAGLTEVSSAIQPWRTHGPTASLARAQEVQQSPSYSPKQTDASCFSRRNERPGSSGSCRAYLSRVQIARTYESVRRFRQILTQRDESALPLWASEAEGSQIPELLRFLQRLRLDWEAVENALLFASSQGQVEGQVNRLKVFKRQGSGRASSALLQARLVAASSLYRKCA